MGLSEKTVPRKKWSLRMFYFEKVHNRSTEQALGNAME